MNIIPGIEIILGIDKKMDKKRWRNTLDKNIFETMELQDKEKAVSYAVLYAVLSGF